MTKLTNLFESGRIGTLTLKNRLIMAAMGNYSADLVGHLPDRMINFYVERAKGGVGLIISTSTMILNEARIPYLPLLYEDRFIPRFQDLSKAIHEHNGKMAIQLMHPGRALAYTRFEFPDAEMQKEIEVIAPSPVPWVANGFVPREASRKDIERIVEAFAEAARRVKDAGFDAIEFHGAHGYLISSFFSGYTNRRNDEYGGDSKNRARFACEILQRARKKVGADFPIIMRISGCDYLQGGITLEDTLIQAPLLVEAGANALHVSASGQETTEWQFPSYLWPDAPIVHLAEAVKKAVDVPVIAVGKIGDPVLANRILEEGRADFVAMGRPFLADPQLPIKAQQERFDDIRRCIYCNNCLIPFTERLKYGGMQCTVNPEVLREKEFFIKPTKSPKKVMVVGGGLAGMEAARVLAQRGHHVTLYEKNDSLGGQWNVACIQEGKKNHYPYLTTYLSRCLDWAEMNIVLNKEVDRQLVQKNKPDVVIMATGATPKSVEVPGIDKHFVVQANDVIQGRALTGGRVLVVGGRLVGMEIADFLAKQGKRVFLVTLHELGQNGRSLERNIYRTVRDSLIRHGVSIFSNTPLAEVTDKGAYVIHNRHLLFLEVDTVVLAIGVKPNNRLAEEIMDLVGEIYLIGDCCKPRDALNAVRDGAEIGRKV